MKKWLKKDSVSVSSGTFHFNEQTKEIIMTLQSEDHKNSAGLIITATLVFSIGYAVVRYHIAGPVPWKDFPFFILNKGISLAAFILLTCNFGFGPLSTLGLKVPAGWLNARKALGMD
jgi:hypothetical protein